MEPAEKNLILVGMMGTGKSTIAKQLAQVTGKTSIDLDEQIIRAAGCSIPDMFANQGEAAFRKLESEVLGHTLLRQGIILATGGGAVLHPDNRNLMLRYGYVIALEADAKTIINRIGADPNRPLLAGDASEKIRKLLAERQNAYQFAHFNIDTSRLSTDEVVTAILSQYQGSLI